MADEKILEGEVLDDEELENVAGGTLQETLEDRDRLDKIGMYKFNNDKGFSGSVNEGFANFGKKYGLKISVEADLLANGSNKYFINDEAISRDELWNIIDETYKSNK